MRGVYSHITPRMRAELCDGLQELWEASLHERVLLAERSAVTVLDGILAGRNRPTFKVGSHLAPKTGHRNGESPGLYHDRGC